ncbi:MMPL family transporter [Saccharothrix texasensis]|uniref:MMPL family transporter n=1 Tax=Saccharothrix texasensis TaxID=103734 RepID=UPI001B86C8DB|nr:MMPL family transporter [Saccharothrix texasensis]
MTVSIAKWSATHPWRAIIGWLAFVAVCVAAGAIVGVRDASSEDYRVGEAGRAETVAADSGLLDPIVERVLVTSPSGPLDQAAADAAAREVADRMRALAEVSSVGAPTRSPNGDAVLVEVTMKATDRTAMEQVAALLDQTAAVRDAHPELVVEQTGGVSIDVGIDEQLAQDLAFAEKLTLPVTLLILLVVFGALVAAGVPVLLGLSSVVTAMALSAVASHVFPDAGATKNVILLLGMAVGVDYSLFYLKREREERARGGGRVDHVTAVELAAATSGRAIVVSGLAVMVSMAGLYLVGDVVFSSLATGSIIVVAVAVVSSLTVLPALLAKFGRWVDRPRVPLLWRLTRRGDGRVWRRALEPSMARPGRTLLVTTGALLLLALPALGMELGLPGNDTLPEEVAEIRTHDRMVASFPGEGARHVVVVRADPARAAEVASAVDGLVARTQGDPLFAPGAARRVSADGRVTVLELPIPFSPESPRAAESLAELRGELVPAAVGGFEHAVSGDVARNVDTVAHQADKLLRVVLFVLLLTFVMIVVAFRSVVMALLTIALNLLATAATFGVLVLVFQLGWAEDLLDFTSGGFIVSRVPLFLFVILFGLSMDYHVFVLSRVREVARTGVPSWQAVREGIAGSAGVVTSAAVVMVSVFVSFVFTGLLEMKQLGLGLAVAVVLDAFVIRLLVLPSAMRLLGRAGWWPSKLSRRPVHPTVESQSQSQSPEEAHLPR